MVHKLTLKFRCFKAVNLLQRLSFMRIWRVASTCLHMHDHVTHLQKLQSPGILMIPSWNFLWILACREYFHIRESVACMPYISWLIILHATQVTFSLQRCLNMTMHSFCVIYLVGVNMHPTKAKDCWMMGCVHHYWQQFSRYLISERILLNSASLCNMCNTSFWLIRDIKSFFLPIDSAKRLHKVLLQPGCSWHKLAYIYSRSLK